MNIRRFILMLTALVLFVSGCGAPGPASSPTASVAAPGSKGDIVLATTTSTQDSGLLDVLIPAFERRTGYRVKPVAVGTGQALKMGELGEADVLLVHAPASEEKFMATGAGKDRKLVMHNDFVIVGPASDPAGIAGTKSAADALRRIQSSGALFISRGDDSGTNKKELELWKAAGITPGGTSYQQTGSGMGQTLRVASEKGGYTLTDRATYLAQKSTLSLQIMVEKDTPLLNIYHVIQVNPAKFPRVNSAGAAAFSDFLVGQEGQSLIGSFGVEKFGQPLFVPDAGKDEKSLGG